MANTVAFPNNAVAVISLNHKHSVFSTKIVNRRAYSIDTWVLDIGIRNHIVCYVNLFTSITAISHNMVELPN